MTKDQKNMKKESMRIINSLRVYQIDNRNQITTEDSKGLQAFKKRNTQAFTARSNNLNKTILGQIYKDNKIIPSRTSNILNLTVPLKHFCDNQESFEYEHESSSLEEDKDPKAKEESD